LKNFIIFLFSLLSTHLLGQNFTTVIGNGASNSSAKVEFYKDHYYVRGNTSQKGTISKLDINGNEIWTFIQDLDGTFNDFTIVNDKIILVGSVGSNTKSKSCIVVLNSADGAIVSSKIYDFSIDLREALVSITNYIDPETSKLRILVSGIEIYVYTGLLYDRVVLLELQDNGAIVKRTILKEDNDNEYAGMSVNPKTNNIMFYGNHFDGGPQGVILKTDKDGKRISGRIFDSAHYFTTHNSNYNATKPTHIFGGRYIGPDIVTLSKYEDDNLIYTYQIPTLTLIQSISKLTEPNTYRALILKNISDPTPYIIDFRDLGTTLEIINSYSVEGPSIDGMGDFMGFYTGNLSNGKNVLSIGRPLTNGFGGTDGVISVFEGDIPKCFQKPTTFNLVKTNLTSQNFNISPRVQDISSSTKLDISAIDFSSKIDCKCSDGQNDSTELTYSICQGNSVTVNNQIYTLAGSYTQTLKTSAGCDSILNIKVTLNQPSESLLNFNICEGNSVTVNNQIYTLAGSYSQTLKTNSGCDSILNISLKVFQSKETSINASICQGESYILNGNSYGTTGIFEEKFKTVNGCDSIVFLNLLVKKKTEALLNFLLCSSPIVVNGIEYDKTGQYIQNLKNNNGCDSTLVINVNKCSETIVYDLEACNAQNQSNTMSYTEFTPVYSAGLDCGTFTATNIFRENNNVNKHSCTEGINTSVAMCVSSQTSCNYAAGASESVVFEVQLNPKENEKMKFNNISFYHQGPKNFNWLNGQSGLNNYPTKFGLRILKDGIEIFKKSDLTTSLTWEKFSESFNDSKFVVSNATKFRVEILPYCAAGVNSQVTAWDLDHLVVNLDCGDGMVRKITGEVVNYTIPVEITKKKGSQNIATVKTSDDGSFAFDGVNAEDSYTVEAHRNIDPLLGVSTKDIIYIQRYLLGLSQLQLEQQIAADINADGKITVSDLVELRRVILGINEAFKSNESWIFVRPDLDLDLKNAQNKKSYDIKPSLQNQDKIDFKGIKIGDVDGSINFSYLQVNNRSIKSLKTASTFASNREEFTIFIEEETNGLQMFLSFLNGEVLSIESNLKDFSSGNYKINNNQLSLSWSSINSNGGYIKFKLNKGTSLVVRDDSEIYTIDNTSKITLSDEENQNNELPNVTRSYPNPTNGIVTFELNHEIETDAKILLYNNDGKEVMSKRFEADERNQTMKIDCSDLPNGAYTYRIFTGQKDVTGKILKMN
jgi:hypothetical protein